MSKLFRRHWGLCLLWMFLDGLCVLFQADTWQIVVLAACVGVLVGIREDEHETRKGPTP